MSGAQFLHWQPRRHPLSAWLCVPGVHGLYQLERQFLADDHPQATADSRLKHTPSLSIKETYFRALTWVSGFRFATQLEAMEVLSGGVGQERPHLHSHSASLQPTITSQKEPSTLTWSTDFCNCSTGTPQNHLAWMLARFIIMAPRNVDICTL